MGQKVSKRYATVLVDGSSMLPTYSPGDWLLARWGNFELIAGANRAPSSWISSASHTLWIARVKVGDVVVIERPEQPGIHYVKRISEIKIASNQIYLLSDNPDGTDSRQWGWLPASSIVAIIIRRVKQAR